MNCKTGLYVVTSCFLGTQLCTAQGPITPTAAPAPTMKTLQEMEPRGMIKSVPITITQPGSYYFTTNLFCYSSSTNAITVNASDVTIDMRGFLLVNNASGSLNGISSMFPNLKVFNGVILEFSGGSGIRGVGNQTIVRDVKVENNNIGLEVGNVARIDSVSALENNSDGIICGSGCVLNGCRTYLNVGDGVKVGPSSILTQCANLNNFSSGIHIIGSTGLEAEFESCAVIDKCTASFNQQHGILAESGANIMNCAANGNGFFETFSGSHGIFISTLTPTSPNSEGSIVRNCTANNNKNDGIRVSNNTEVIGNSASGNGQGPPMGSTSWAGISAYGDNNLIKENVTASNIGDALYWNVSGILVDGNKNRIESNHSSGNAFLAYEVLTANGLNFIVKNTAYGTPAGSDYSIVAGNFAGTIITPTGNALAIPPNNNSGLGITAGVTDTPWANFDD